MTYMHLKWNIASANSPVFQPPRVQLRSGRLSEGWVRGGQPEQREQETLLRGEEGGPAQWQQQSGGGIVRTRATLIRAYLLYIMES